MTTISISAKCSDMFFASICKDGAGQIGEYDGYVPECFGPNGYGDYVKLEVNVETGQIVGWDAEAAKEFVEENS